MYHCRQCRADAIGSLGQDCSARFRDDQTLSTSADEKSEKRFTALVTSSDRQIINQHFGHAENFYIYRYDEGMVQLLEIRDVKKYCGGPGECEDDEEKFAQISKAAADCDVILTMRIGERPRRFLEQQGKRVIATYGFINEEIQKAANLLEHV
jgi:predicted Fe-Mo cluster-binding NifX family protein